MSIRFAAPRRRIGIIAVAAAVVAATLAHDATAKPDPVKAAALAKHLAAASTTIRSATSSVLKLEAAIEQFNDAQGALPKAKVIRAACETVSSSGADRRLTTMSVPPALQSRHLRLAASFTQASDGCVDITPTLDTAIASLELAIQTRTVTDLTTALEDLTAAMRDAKDLGRKLRPCAQARAAWRFTVLQYATAIGLKPPLWVKNLK